MIINNDDFLLEALENQDATSPKVSVYSSSKNKIGEMYITNEEPKSIASFRFASLEEPVDSKILSSIIKWASTNWDNLKSEYQSLQHKECKYMAN